MLRRCVLAASAALALTAVVGCGSSSSKSSSSSSTSAPAASTSQSSSSTSAAGVGKGPIKILSIADTTGPTKLYGSIHEAGLEAGAAYLNSQGGIDGRKVVITHVTDNGDPTVAVTDLVKYLSSNPPPTMVDAGAEGAIATALAPELAKNKSLYAESLNDGAGTCGTNAAKTCPQQFAMQAPPLAQQQVVVNWLKQHGVKKVGMLEEAIDFTEAEAPEFKQALKAAGISEVTVTFPETATSVTPEMSELKGDGVQAIYALALGAPAGYALTARSQLGWNVPVVFDPAASSVDITKLAPAALTKNAYVDVYQASNPKADIPGRALLLKYAKPFANIGPVPLDVSGLGWDEMLVLANAVKQAGSTNPAALTKAMLNLDATAASDPDYVTAHHFKYTTTNHENIGGSTADYFIAPVGPIVDGQIK
jgi:branched-chain amino acid transport system substrate-binding protein